MILALREGTSLSGVEIITLVLGLAVSMALMLLGYFSVSIMHMKSQTFGLMDSQYAAFYLHF